MSADVTLARLDMRLWSGGCGLLLNAYLSAKYKEPLCGPPFLQVACDRRGRS
jgi:hypothetical protein